LDVRWPFAKARVVRVGVVRVGKGSLLLLLW